MIISKGRSLLARWLLVGLLVGCSTSLRAFAEKRADFRCSYTYQKTTVTTTKNNPARSDGGRDSKVEKSKVALRRIFVFPLLLDTLALSQCLRSARNVTSSSIAIRRAAPAAHRAKRLGFSTRWDTGGWRAQNMRYRRATRNTVRSRHNGAHA